MIRLTIAAALVALAAQGAADASEKINLRTAEGVRRMKGEWRYAPVKIVEITATDPDGSPTPTYDYQPKATGPDFDDKAWPVIDPATLGRPRGGGKVCFAWYRIRVTIPPEAKGKRVFFQTTVDDYGEVWVDGKLPREVGKTGEAIVAGFNAPNRVELKGAEPGRPYQIAVFGINGPISATPGNRIFLSETFLDFTD
jgi:hypothetical protein